MSSFTQIIEHCKGSRLVSWQQGSMINSFKLPADSYNGMCLALCGIFIGNSQEYLKQRDSQKFKIDALNLHTKYKGIQQSEGISGARWISDHYLGFKPESQSPDTPFASGWPTQFTQSDGRYLISLFKAKSGGHAIAAVVQAQKKIYPDRKGFILFDPNDGVAEFDGLDGLARAVGYHLNDNYLPLVDPGDSQNKYTSYQVTKWKL